MFKDERKLIMLDPIDEVAAAIAVSTGDPVVMAMFETPNGGIEGAGIRPDSLERVRGGIGHFIIKGEVVIGTEIGSEIIISVNPFAEDGQGSRVELIPNTPAA